MDLRSKTDTPNTSKNTVKPTMLSTMNLGNMSVDEKLDMLIKGMMNLESVPGDIISMRTSIDGLQKDIKEIPVIQRRLVTIENDMQSQKEKTEKTIKTSEALEASITNAQTSVDEFTKQVKELKDQLTENKKTIAMLESTLARDEKKILNLSKKAVEDEKIKMNVATMLEIQGVPEDSNENLCMIVKQIFYDTGVKVDPRDIDEIYREGNYSKRRPHTIIVTMTKASTRNDILRNRQEIKKNPNCKFIWMNEVVPDQVKTQRNELHALHNLALKNGHNSRHILDTLIIDGITYSHGTIHRLPAGIKLEAPYTREIGNFIYFNSEHVFLSNFSPCNIDLADAHCTSLEQAYFFLMAQDLGNMKVAQLILDTHSPREIKKIGSTLIATMEWNQKAPQIMFDLLKLKFQQNPELKARLIATGGKRLVESTQSKFWGCGLTIPMIDRQVKKTGQVKTTGRNILGAQLEDVRRDLDDVQNTRV